MGRLAPTPGVAVSSPEFAGLPNYKQSGLTSHKDMDDAYCKCFLFAGLQVVSHLLVPVQMAARHFMIRIRGETVPAGAPGPRNTKVVCW